jgi:hypothetical protein
VQLVEGRSEAECFNKALDMLDLEMRGDDVLVRPAGRDPNRDERLERASGVTWMCEAFRTM